MARFLQDEGFKDAWFAIYECGAPEYVSLQVPKWATRVALPLLRNAGQAKKAPEVIGLHHTGRAVPFVVEILFPV